jgi:hypothetical protein
MRENTCTISVSFGNDNKTATVRFSNRVRVTVANLLGVDTDDQGNPLRLYFDGLLTRGDADDVTYIGWLPSGCISTILTKVAV